MCWCCPADACRPWLKLPEQFVPVDPGPTQAIPWQDGYDVKVHLSYTLAHRIRPDSMLATFRAQAPMIDERFNHLAFNAFLGLAQFPRWGLRGLPIGRHPESPRAIAGTFLN